MELRQLRTFQAVASLQSFNLAAKELHYAQSTVSEQIKGLEYDLDVQLFTRSGKYISLTKSGEMLLQYARRILDIEEELKSEIVYRDEHHGALSVRIPETVGVYYLPTVLKKFHKNFPKIRCSFNSSTYFNIQRELKSGMMNLAFLITDEDFREPNMEVETLLNIPLIFVTNPQNPLAKKEHIEITDFRNQTIILPKRDCSYRMMFERALIKHKVEPANIFDFSSLESKIFS
jgi:DNA-binding transcriptional LysR family regulator